MNTEQKIVVGAAALNTLYGLANIKDLGISSDQLASLVPMLCLVGGAIAGAGAGVIYLLNRITIGNQAEVTRSIRQNRQEADERHKKEYAEGLVKQYGKNARIAHNIHRKAEKENLPTYEEIMRPGGGS